jgi:ERCC4-related helicase
VLLFPKRSTEVALNKYLMETEKVSLIQACFLIINSLKVTKADNHNEEVTLVVTHPKLDALAQLITYGNEKVQGSQILKQVLNYK